MKSSFWALLIFVGPILSSPLLQKRYKYSYNGCSASQQAIIEYTLDDMQALAAQAVTASEPGNPAAAFIAWFGNGAGQKISDENVNIRFHKLSLFKTQVPKKDITFDCTQTAPCCNAGL